MATLTGAYSVSATVELITPLVPWETTSVSAKVSSASLRGIAGFSIASLPDSATITAFVTETVPPYEYQPSGGSTSIEMTWG